MAKILIVDDKAQMREVLRKFLAAEGYAVETAGDAESALALFAAGAFDLVLSDIRMPLMDGNELLGEILRRRPDAIVILMTAFGSIEAAVEAIKQGATDYISKPFQMEEVLLRIGRALNERRLAERVAELERRVSHLTALDRIVGTSAPVRKLRQIIERVAPLAETVLIRGETGTGKELVARALHDAGPRAPRPFVALDCSSLPETLIESELFGHEKGSFTGANETRKGLFETAADGTLFLDEIESLSPAVQSKLLRVLQEREFRRVGGRKDIRFAARVVSATNMDLEKLIDDGAFRRDLYYRFAVLPISVPPLRERREDIPELIEALVARRGAAPVRFTPDAIARLAAHSWPGNVRELENVVFYAAALGGEVVGAEDLPPLGGTRDQMIAVAPDTPLAELERAHILRVFESAGRNRIKTAGLLGIDRRTLYNKLKAYGIE